MTQKIVTSLTKIITFFAFFYSAVKLFAIVQGAWLLANLTVILALILIGLAGAFQIRKATFSKWYVLVSGALIVLLRIFEQDLIPYLNGLFN